VLGCYSAQGLGDVAQLTIKSGLNQLMRLARRGHSCHATGMCGGTSAGACAVARLPVAHRWLAHDEVFAEGMRKLRGWHRARPKGWRLTLVLDRNDEGWEAVVLLTKDGGRLRRLRRKHHHRASAVAGGGRRSSCSSRARRGK
jgi:hypothetical protein